MNQNQPNATRIGFEAASLILGFGAGILGTLIYATYKQKEFESVLHKTRDLAGNAEERMQELGDRAQDMNRDVTRAAHSEVNRANQVTTNAIDSVRKAMSDHA